MRVPRGTTVLVADGGKMLLLENRGEAFNLRLEVIEQQAQNVPPDRELGTDRPGRSHSSVGPGRSAMQETDFHEQAEDRFLAEVAGFLGVHSRINGNNVVVIAPPRTLDRLRQHYPNGTAARVLAAIPNDRTGPPGTGIPRQVPCLM